jgi:hypothetical protein
MCTTLLAKLRGNEDLLRAIYAYDDTYQTLFKRTVLPAIGRHRWHAFLASFTCPFLRAVATYLVHKYRLDHAQHSCHRGGRTIGTLGGNGCAITPDQLSIWSTVDLHEHHHVRVYLDVGHTIYYGVAFTPSQYDTYVHAYDDFDPWMEAYRDPDTGIVVCE